MYADQTLPRGVKRPVKDRLGASFVRSSASVLDRQAALKRQRQDIINWNNSFNRERSHVTGNDVPKDLKTSDLQKDVLKSLTDKISTATEIQKKALRIAGAPKNVCPGETKATTPVTELISAKKPAVQFASTATGEKKHVVSEELTVKVFLQRLGLSKYDITFQAEEVDMFALKHMNDDDLKSMGLPMGPRKKILIALAPAPAKARR